MTEQLSRFPSQKKSEKQKNKEWIKDCIDAAQNLAMFVDQGVRATRDNKIINYNLFNGILDQNDIQRMKNPLNIAADYFPAKLQHYPIANPKIQLLIGEESKRAFNWTVRVTNEDAISKKEESLSALMQEKITSLFLDKNMDEAATAEAVRKINKWKKYQYQDVREVRANRILNYLWKDQFIKEKFNLGFKDALIASEEIYCADIVAGEPTFRVVNPLNLYTIRSGNSPYIEDSDIIIEENYLPMGKVVDMYYDYLTPSQIDELETGDRKYREGKTLLQYGPSEPTFNADGFGDGMLLLNPSRYDVRAFGGSYDDRGNIRVMRVMWKSRRKFIKVKVTDEYGYTYEDLRSEYYKPQEGEDAQEIWLNEWWEGTKIGQDMYIKTQPFPRIGTRMDNLSICQPPYVGLAYNVNDSRSNSLMDRMKPYQYLYDVIMYRTEMAIAKNLGKIAELDMSKIPDGWTMDKWMYYATVMGFAPIDPFKEGKKGAAQGKLAGQWNTTGKTLDLETGSYIQHHISMLTWIEEKIGTISGVTPQREGQVTSSETVGGVERAVSQSSHITEEWFSLHDNLKIKALTRLLEVAKFCWKGKKKKLQFISDELTTEMFEVDGEDFADSEYGVFLSNTQSDTQLFEALKQLAHAGIQNDKLNFSMLMDIYTTDSIASIKRKIETYEEEAQQNAERARKEELQVQQQMNKEKLDFEKYKIELQAKTEIQKALISKGSEEGTEDASLELEKLRIEEEKFRKEYELKTKELEEVKRSNKVKEEQNKEKLSIDRIKANKPTSSKK